MSSTLTLFDEIKKRAVAEVGNQFLGSLALLRERILRLLGMLSDANPKLRDRVLSQIADIYSFLMREIALANRVKRQVRQVYPCFVPEEHYAKIEYDKDGREISRVVVPIENIALDLHDARHKWTLAELVIADCKELQESIAVYPDSYYNATGAAVIQKFLTPSDTRTNFAIDEPEAEQIRQLWGLGKQPQENGNGESKK